MQLIKVNAIMATYLYASISSTPISRFEWNVEHVEIFIHQTQQLSAVADEPRDAPANVC